MTVNYDAYFESVIDGLDMSSNLQFYKADTFPTIHPVHWLTSHFAVGGFSPLKRLSGMLTAHMTQIAPRNGFRWHPHRGLEIYTYVIDGQLYHEDTTGGRGKITAGTRFIASGRAAEKLRKLQERRLQVSLQIL